MENWDKWNKIFMSFKNTDELCIPSVVLKTEKVTCTRWRDVTCSQFEMCAIRQKLQTMLWRSCRITSLSPHQYLIHGMWQWVHLYSLLVVAYPMPSALLLSSSEALTAFRGIFPPLRVSSLRCWSGGTNRRSVFLLFSTFTSDRTLMLLPRCVSSPALVTAKSFLWCFSA